MITGENTKNPVNNNTEWEGGRELTGNWKEHGTLFYLNPPNLSGNNKILGFDMDDTLITIKSGSDSPLGRKDWKWLSEDIPKILKNSNEKGFKIVIFTNQGGIFHNSSGKIDIKRAEQLKGKIEDIIFEIGFPVQVFISGNYDEFRKPSRSMWDFMVKYLNEGIEPKLDESWFIGDSAGRPLNWKIGKEKDWSCHDRKFALNIGINFSTPEEFFWNEEKSPFILDE